MFSILAVLFRVLGQLLRLNDPGVDRDIGHLLGSVSCNS